MNIVAERSPATLEVRRFQWSDTPAIERLNRRLAAAGVPHSVGVEDRRRDEPSLEVEPIIERLFVAASGDEIRGGVWLKEQRVWANGRFERVGWAKYPVAESLIDGTAAGVPASLLFNMLRQQPRLMALGMGGHTARFARLLAAAGWASSSVPFFFRFLRPSRVLRHLSYARTTRARRMVADGLALSGAAWAANALVTGVRAAMGPRPPRGYEASVVSGFGGWSDELWERCRDSYGFIAARDSRALNALYPAAFRRLVRLRVRRGGSDAGWIAVRAIDAPGTWFERHFGSLRLGILTDGLARPEDAAGVLQCGFRYLVDAGVDLVVTYQYHPAWCAAALASGFMRGPSNCAFYRSSAAEKLIAEAVAARRFCHLTCSDGDGPESV